ncbi:MAG: GPR endopeptidase [Oscillospiraceae bacterium]|nr:GPR endopeptidase [Oscillospiraceae bacterium]MBR7084853.1 GPR endopeptidase [Oscillospiraceae bacterium]
MICRTDLALESVTEQFTGWEQHERGQYFQIHEIQIKDELAEKKFGKPKGNYITLEGESLSGFSAHYPQMTEEFAQELRKLLPEEGLIFVAGLGNQNITPDALGVRTAEKIIATRHLKQELAQEEEDFLKNLRPVSALAGGVLGQTGIESAELIQAVCEKIHPAAVIAVDALACTAAERLGKTIQIADTGIAPGSGVSNHRKALTLETLRIPVIGIGVPTVINMQYLAEHAPNFMVAPRDIDRLITQAAHLLSCGINMALQPDMSYEDIANL